MQATAQRGSVRAPAALKELFGELGDLKRVRSAGREGSAASRLFRFAWAELAAGRETRAVAVALTAAALAGARLGDVDRRVLTEAGVPDHDAVAILRRAVEDIAGAIPPPLRRELVDGAGHRPAALPAAPPPFVTALEQQPRAGVTCPGKPRIMLQPAENHAEHCLLVAVYGVLLASAYEADVGTVFLAGLAHHLHNAGLPDSGFTGETLLGEHLGPMVDHFTEAFLGQLAPPLRREVERARKILPDAGTPEGRAFHAADVIDRVLEIGQHVRASSLTMDQVLGDMRLVHEGPVKSFHDRVLREMGLP